MSKTELLEHPDLYKVWDALESAAPHPDWTGVNVTRPPAPRRRNRMRRTIALAMAVFLIVIVGTETKGVLAARRAIADGPVVIGAPMTLAIDTLELSEPWGSSQLADLSQTGAGVIAFGVAGSDDDPLAVWRLEPDAWVPVGVAANVITDGETFHGAEYMIGREDAGGPEDSAHVWRFDASTSAWEQVLDVRGQARGAHLSGVVVLDDQLVVTGAEELGRPTAWVSDDGAAWEEIAVESGLGTAAIQHVEANSERAVAIGYRDSALPLIGQGQPAIWARDGSGDFLEIPTPDLGALGFGYLIGGFRLSDGLEQIAVGPRGFVAFTGYLQAWDRFQDLTLEPEEAWSSLVLLSEEGLTWQPYVLPEFAIYSMVALGDGFLAAAAPSPFENEDVIPNHLFYSEDGLVWRAVVDSPAFGKPLLVSDGTGGAFVLDEYQAEDPDDGVTIVYQISLD